MISRERQKRILHGYLGPYGCNPSEEVRNALRRYDRGDSLFIHDNRTNEIITYLLVKDGRQGYQVVSSHHLIDLYLDNGS